MAENKYTLTGNTNQLPRFASGTNNDAVSEREQLANFISNITRDETPFMSDIGKTKAVGVYHEWQTDRLEPPRNSRLKVGADFDHVRPDGSANDGADNALAAAFTVPRRTRLGNYTQINGKTVAVSGTKRAVDQAGVADEYAYQLKKRGIEMRRDMEQDLIHSLNVSFPESGTNEAVAGNYFAWINSDLDSTTQSGTCKFKIDGLKLADANVGHGTHTLGDTDGVGVALALTDIDEVMQAIYENGGKAGKVMLSPKLRRDFSSLAQAAGTGTNVNVRRNIDEKGSLRQSVDFYMSDFGEIMIVPNYIMGLSHSVTTNGNAARTHARQMKDFAALVYDSQWFNMSTLRPMQEVDVGQKGDSTVGMFVEEWTFEVRNPYGCGGIYGLA